MNTYSATIQPANPRALSAPKSAASTLGPILFVAVHVPLALLIRHSALAATIHAVATLLVALVVVIQPYKVERVAYVCAYIAGAEVLWRMAGASILWEVGKYAVSALFLLAIFRSRRLSAPALPFLYFGLLLPSVVPLLYDPTLTTLRKDVSFNLSGPFSLMACTWFFSRLNISRRDLCKLLVVCLAPIVAIAAMAVLGIISAEHVTFGSSSNVETSGGFGPNQVSSVLGLGVLAALLYVASGEGNLVSQIFMMLVAIFLAAQSAITFSRGGLYSTAGSVLIAILFLAGDSRKSLRFVLSIVPIAAIGAFVVWPALNNYTGGKLEARFENTKASGREEIAEGDFELWNEHPVLGVGPGQSKRERNTHHGIVAHTEYTRLFAEHGTLGLAALVILLLMGVVAVSKAPTAYSKAVTASLSSWSYLYMLHAGMRLVMPAFILGLAMARLSADRAANDAIQLRRDRDE